MPAKFAELASGSSTCHMRCHAVIPMPSAEAKISALMTIALKPQMVFSIIGNNPYIISATNTG